MLLRDLEILVQQLTQAPIRLADDLQTDNGLPFAFLQQLFHAAAEVVVLRPGVLVNKNVCVSGDPDGAAVPDVVLFEQQRCKMSDQRVR